MKIMLRYARIMLSLSVVCALFSTQIVAASGYTITIDDSSSSKNQSLIFDEQNIGPGFLQEYPVEIINQSSRSIEVRLDGLIEEPSNTISSDELDLMLEKAGDVKYGSPSALSLHEPIMCLSPNTTGLFFISIGLDESFGNDYQQRIYSAEFTFEAKEAICHDTMPGLPNTGENRDTYFALISLVIFFTIATIISLIIFMASRRRRDKE